MTVPDLGPVIDLGRLLQETAAAEGEHLPPLVARALARVALTYWDTEVTGDEVVPAAQARDADAIAQAWTAAETVLLQRAHLRGLAVVSPLQHSFEKHDNGDVTLRYIARARTIIK